MCPTGPLRIDYFSTTLIKHSRFFFSFLASSIAFHSLFRSESHTSSQLGLAIDKSGGK